MTIQRCRSHWRLADRLRLDWVSVSDHLVAAPRHKERLSLFEATSCAVAIACDTTRVRIGILVAPVSQRSPAMLAKVATTIDHLSGGRFELGLGVGWYGADFRAAGVVALPFRRRWQHLAEVVRALRQLWTEPSVTCNGSLVRLASTVSEPKPLQRPHVPLWIGGDSGEHALAAVGELETGWNCYAMPIDRYRHLCQTLVGHCQVQGRDPGAIRRSIVFVPALGRDAAAVGRRLGDLRTLDPAEFEASTDMFLAGTPDECVRHLGRYQELGATDFLIDVDEHTPAEQISLFAEAVVPLARERFA
jgi:alkanesulfonate monooxygenase SsuD/methylene tetrahydromethanopterin reductase-like flavin-dependent oxidoreductase (luciferase family)